MFPDYLLNDLLQGTLILSLLWSVAVVWLILVGFRYFMRQHKRIDALREANEILTLELEQCYASRRDDEWIDVLARDLFGEDHPSNPELRAV